MITYFTLEKLTYIVCSKDNFKKFELFIFSQLSSSCTLGLNFLNWIFGSMTFHESKSCPIDHDENN